MQVDQTRYLALSHLPVVDMEVQHPLVVVFLQMVVLVVALLGIAGLQEVLAYPGKVMQAALMVAPIAPEAGEALDQWVCTPHWLMALEQMVARGKYLPLLVVQFNTLVVVEVVQIQIRQRG